MANNRVIGRLLKEARQRRGESLRAAAEQLRVDPAHLSRVESGAKPPSEALQRMASDYYGIPNQELSLANGDIPADVLEILQKNPELMDEIRRYR